MPNLHETLPLFISTLDRPLLNDAVSYISEIKRCFGDHPDKYEAFCNTLVSITEARCFHNGDIVTLHQIQPSHVAAIRDKLHGERDLLAAFDSYLPPKYKSPHRRREVEAEQVLSDINGSSMAEEVDAKKRKIDFDDSTDDFFDTVADKARKKLLTVSHSVLGEARDSLTESSYIHLLRVFNVDKQKNMVEKMKKQESFPGCVVDLKKYLEECEEIAAEIGERISPSYVVVESSSSSSSGILNDQYKCIAPESVNRGKRKIKIDKKEESLKNMEDDQSELASLIEWFKSAISYAKYLLGDDEIEESVEQENKGDEEIDEAGRKRLEEEKSKAEELKKEVTEENEKTFERMFNGCIEKLGEEHMQLYKEYSREALPVLLFRFQQRLQTYLAFKLQYDKICAKAYDKHFKTQKVS